MGFFKKLFGQNKKVEETTPEPGSSQEEEHNKDDELKVKGLENVLCTMHNMVGHAIIPFDLGGSVDTYYFLNHIPGTGFATMELLDLDGKGPKPNTLGTYELAAFTRLPYNSSQETQTPFNLIAEHICGIFTTIGNYSFEAVLNPNETCEIPMDEGENRYLIFDNYQPNNKEFKIGERKHHLLLCMEIFKSEMEFARENGGDQLLTKLKQAGYYPYSDLDREPVSPDL